VKQFLALFKDPRPLLSLWVADGWAEIAPTRAHKIMWIVLAGFALAGAGFGLFHAVTGPQENIGWF